MTTVSPLSLQPAVSFTLNQYTARRAWSTMSTRARTRSLFLRSRLLFGGARVCQDRDMGLGGALLLVAGFAIVFANVVTTRRLWASAIFETSQKVAQTALMWLVPGAAIVVWNVLREPRLGSQPDPTTAGAAFLVTDWLLGSSGDSRHHGSAGGHQGGDGHDSAGNGDGGHHGGYGGDGGHGGGFDGGGGGDP
jgi:hypothetical protein